MIKVTMKELVLAQQALMSLNTKENNLSGKNLFHLAGIMHKIQMFYDQYDAARNTLLERLGVESDTGFTMEGATKENRKQFSKEIDELLAAEVEISDSQLPLSSLEEGGIRLTISEMVALLFLFYDDSSDTPDN